MHQKILPLPESAYPQLLDIVASVDGFVVPVLISFVSHMALFYGVVWSFPNVFDAKPAADTSSSHSISSKRKAWVLTLVSALTIVTGATPLFIRFLMLPSGATIADLPGLDGTFVPTASSTELFFLWQGVSANALARVFLGYLVADMVAGSIHYRSQIGLVTGWIHHIGYTVCILSCIKYQIIGGFLCFASILELPTIVLATGHILPRYRQDLLFGALFFVTRVVIHMYVVWHVYNTYASNFWMVTVIPLPVHIYWFGSWANNQIRKWKKMQKEAGLNGDQNKSYANEYDKQSARSDHSQMNESVSNKKTNPTSAKSSKTSGSESAHSVHASNHVKPPNSNGIVAPVYISPPTVSSGHVSSVTVSAASLVAMEMDHVMHKSSISSSRLQHRRAR